MQTLIDAYCKLFGERPKELNSWEITRSLISGLDPRSLGEELACKIICHAICFQQYPNMEIQFEVIGRAEDMASEHFEEFRNRDSYFEVHSEEMDWIARKRGYVKLC